jgi:hypothetical protein
MSDGTGVVPNQQANIYFSVEGVNENHELGIRFFLYIKDHTSSQEHRDC